MTTITAASSKPTYSTNTALARELNQVIVVLTNTTTEGMSGVFSVAVRDAIYRAIAE
jgi:hypothetical protein